MRGYPLHNKLLIWAPNSSFTNKLATTNVGIILENFKKHTQKMKQMYREAAVALDDLPFPHSGEALMVLSACAAAAEDAIQYQEAIRHLNTRMKLGFGRIVAVEIPCLIRRSHSMAAPLPPLQFERNNFIPAVNLLHVSTLSCCTSLARLFSLSSSLFMLSRSAIQTWP